MCEKSGRQRGAETLWASPGEGGAAGSTFSKFSPNSAPGCLWSGLWLTGLYLRPVAVLTLLLGDLWQETTWLQSLGRCRQKGKQEMAGEGPRGYQLLWHNNVGRKNCWKAEYSEVLFFSCCFSAVAPLPEMSDWHWEASLQAAQHSHRLEGRRLCREDNSWRTSAGTQGRSD